MPSRQYTIRGRRPRRIKRRGLRYALLEPLIDQVPASENLALLSALESPLLYKENLNTVSLIYYCSWRKGHTYISNADALAIRAELTGLAQKLHALSLGRYENTGDYALRWLWDEPRLNKFYLFKRDIEFNRLCYRANYHNARLTEPDYWRLGRLMRRAALEILP